MRPPSLSSRRSRAILAVLAMAAAGSVQAEEAPPLPTCRPTVAVPPPEPPARPEGLVAERPANPPMAAAPAPPARPADIAGPTPERPADANGPTPAIPGPTVPPPETAAPPLQLQVEPSRSPAELPTCAPTLVAPLPPPRLNAVPPVPDALLEPPRPPARPPELSPGAAPVEEAPLPPVRPAELAGEDALAIAPPEDTACLRSLDALGLKYAKLAPIVNGQCSVPHPLSVTGLGNGVAIGAAQTMTCRLAEGLTRWTSEVRQIGEKELGEAVSGLTLGGTYVCRGQNHGAEAQLSEHAFANAVDVMGFTFSKRAAIAVGKLDEGSKEAAFLAAVRAKACEHFTTVLGPGTDEPHANHLHLDERERKASRLCQ